MHEISVHKQVDPVSHSGAMDNPGTKSTDQLSTATPTIVDTSKLKVGTRLRVKFDDGRWYPGTIEKKIDDECKYRILYDDGETEETVIKQLPSDEFIVSNQSDFNIRVWRTVLSMTEHNSAVVGEHEAARERRRQAAQKLPKNIRDLWWQVVWAQQAGFPAWPSLVVVRI